MAPKAAVKAAAETGSGRPVKFVMMSPERAT